MRLRHVIPVAMSLLALGSGAVASADGRDGHGNRVDFVPVHRVGGATGGELMGQWWGHVIEIPNAQNPFGVGTEALCVNLGRRGNVVAPLSNGQPATCTVRAGGDVFIPLTSAECSSNEPDPFHGDTEEEQRACAIDWVRTAPVTAISLALDGGPAVAVKDERYFVISPQLSAVFPSDPVAGAHPGPTTFVAAGYAATLRRHLRPGEHVINGVAELSAGEPLTFTINLVVVRRGHGR